MSRKECHVHLVSDATGETNTTLARACLAQFPDVEPNEHIWTLVRTQGQIDRVLSSVAVNPGVVLFTIANPTHRQSLIAGCRDIDVPCLSILDPLLGIFANYLGLESSGQPGGQHALTQTYFERIAAMEYTLTHDDGQSTQDLNAADVVLVGVSRTSKTPTCLYLANRGLKSANIPMVPNVPLPPELFTATSPLIVGLTTDVEHLVQVRRNRLRLIADGSETDYVDTATVRDEVNKARRLFTEQGWPVINVSRRSIEETAATVLQYFQERKESVQS
ncbi:MAG: pyruvate, water dikinase regulatory protein [Pseudomonadota bacterium]